MSWSRKDGKRLKRNELCPIGLERVRQAARERWKAHAAARRADPEVAEHDRVIRAATKKARRRNAQTWAMERLPNLRAACARRKIPCTITLSDIVIPPTCPVLGIPIILGAPRGSDHLPSIDRRIPGLGYVPGNVTVISRRANVLKNNSVDPAELRRVADYVEECVSS